MNASFSCHKEACRFTLCRVLNEFKTYKCCSRDSTQFPIQLKKRAACTLVASLMNLKLTNAAREIVRSFPHGKKEEHIVIIMRYAPLF